jgi:uncharacterized protein
MKKKQMDLPKHDHQALKALFGAEPLAELSFGLYHGYGFILHMVSAPDIVQPSEWLPMLFKSGELPEFKSKSETDAVVGGLLSIWQHWADESRDGEMVALPPGCVLDADGQPTPELFEFCSGYLLGCEWLRELWDEALEGYGHESAEERILTGAMLFCLRLSHGTVLPPDDASPEAQKLVAMPPAQALEMLPAALTDTAALGRALHMESLRASRPVKAPAGPGRNDPCPCGSGKKYKKCCM